jgi:5-methylcytosine-specific restriction endonuclease McrA
MIDPKFLKEFFNIITIGRKSNTYKFALARSILEFVKENKPQIIQNVKEDKDTVINYSVFAEDFFRYYWYQEKLKIPQNFNTDTLPRAVSIVKDIYKESTQPEKFDMVKEEIKSKAIKKILSGVFNKYKNKTSQVVPRFQNIIEGKETMEKETFYKNDEDNKRILVNADAMEFFIHYRILLEKFVVLEWAKFLDHIKTAPGIISKIEDPVFDRTSLKPQEKILRRFFKNCFYCERDLENLPKDVKIHVDHFIPRSYIAEDELWNLVLSCSECNLNKSDSLAIDFKNNLIRDNNLAIHEIPELKKSLKNLDNNLDWVQEMIRIYDNCLEYGFTEISKSKILERKK